MTTLPSFFPPSSTTLQDPLPGKLQASLLSFHLKRGFGFSVTIRRNSLLGKLDTEVTGSLTSFLSLESGSCFSSFPRRKPSGLTRAGGPLSRGPLHSTPWVGQSPWGRGTVTVFSSLLPFSQAQQPGPTSCGRKTLGRHQKPPGAFHRARHPRARVSGVREPLAHPLFIVLPFPRA